MNREKKARTLQDLDLCDDFLFGEVMTDREICRQVLEKILDIRIGDITFLDNQVALDKIYDAHGIRMDVQAKDDNGTVFTVEMQSKRKSNEGRRSRYYHSLIDVGNLLGKGEDYRTLADNYVIFICAFDMFGLGRHIYRFASICEEDKTTYLEDGQHTIILNTEGADDDVDSELKALLRYARESTDENAANSNSVLVSMIHEKVKDIKKSQKAGERFMSLELKLRDEREEGKKEGKQEGFNNAIMRLKLFGMSEERISEALAVPKEKVIQIVRGQEEL